LSSLERAEGIDEVIIVDNGNPPAEIAALDDFAARKLKSRVLRGHGNIGFARACNLGAAHADSETLVFLNPDVTLASDAIPRLLEALAAAPPPALIGGDLRDGEGEPDRGSRRERLTSWRAFVSVTGLSRFARWAPVLRDFNRHTEPLPAAPIRVNCISGALFVIRHKASVPSLLCQRMSSLPSPL
jgi:GT2 family glycosyltransferase